MSITKKAKNRAMEIFCKLSSALGPPMIPRYSPQSSSVSTPRVAPSAAKPETDFTKQCKLQENVCGVLRECVLFEFLFNIMK